MNDYVLSVSELNEYVRRSLAADPMLRGLRVRGEISGFKRPASGHLYFTVKDETARVACVMFRQNALSLGFVPTDGTRVIVTGSASLYAATGAFQLYCDGLEREGEGALFARFEALKRKLLSEGLFDESLKKPLPLLPRRIGLVTSRSGAALHDMLRVIRRRNPRADIVLCAASVQGAEAAQELADALDLLNARDACDVILFGRGGGSTEDLFAFNEERVARAIARSRIPVVSCVGHEVDFTIADFVADVRAATPSVAAEIATPDVFTLSRDLAQCCARLYRAQSRRLLSLRAGLDRHRAVYRDPAALLFGERKLAIAAHGQRLERAMAQAVATKRLRLDALARGLHALDPGMVLRRGYAVVLKGASVCEGVSALAPGDQITLRMRGGAADATVRAVERAPSESGVE